MVSKLEAALAGLGIDHATQRAEAVDLAAEYQPLTERISGGLHGMVHNPELFGEQMIRRVCRADRALRQRLNEAAGKLTQASDELMALTAICRGAKQMKEVLAHPEFGSKDVRLLPGYNALNKVNNRLSRVTVNEAPDQAPETVRLNFSDVVMDIIDQLSVLQPEFAKAADRTGNKSISETSRCMSGLLRLFNDKDSEVIDLLRDFRKPNHEAPRVAKETLAQVVAKLKEPRSPRITPPQDGEPGRG